MFASLFDCLLQTFIVSFTAMFEDRISNFTQLSGDAVEAIFDGLIGCIMKYVFAAICDIYSVNNNGIFTSAVDVGLAIVSVFIAMIDNQAQACLFDHTMYCVVVTGADAAVK